jgi:O-antigen ligase
VGQFGDKLSTNSRAGLPVCQGLRYAINMAFVGLRTSNPQLTHFVWVFFLFILVFLGDGKQSIIDVVGMAGILCLFVVHRMRGGVISPLPRGVAGAWSLVLGFFVIRTIFSDSVGYSLLVTGRWIMAYLIFLLFASISWTEEQRNRFSLFLTWFVGSIAVVSFVFSLFESLHGLLPSMNLLYATFGHNHVANLIVFISPFVLYRFVGQRDKESLFLAFLFGISLIFSFARGAWLLLGCYAGYFLITTRSFSAKARTLGTMAIVAAVVAPFALTFVSSYLPQNALRNQMIKRQVIKDSIFNNRLPYWREAADSITERPLFGAGPGTFYLLSKRFQEAPNKYSWFAHSFPLELGAEVGLLGVVCVAILAFFLRPLFFLFDPTLRPFRDAVVLTILYSFYEINLNFLVVWLLLWTLLGMLFSQARHPMSPKGQRGHLWVICLGALGVFYFSSVATSVLGLFPGTRPLSFYGEPYVVGRVIAELHAQKPMPAKMRPLALYFHRRDPEVLSALADNVQEISPALALFYSRQALSLDSKNRSLFDAYIKMLKKSGGLVTQDELDELPRLFYDHSLLIQPESAGGALLLQSSSPYAIDQMRVASEALLASEGDKFLLAKGYYMWGLALSKTYPSEAREAFEAATRLARYWAYFYLELASHLFYVENDIPAAQKALDRCMQELHAKDHCIEFSLETLPQPGAFKEEILSIP